MLECNENVIALAVTPTPSESSDHQRAVNYSHVGWVQGQWHRGTFAPRPAQWSIGLMLGLLVWGWFWVAGVAAAPFEEMIPIGSITVNPMANNRRAVILHGKTSGLSTYQGRDGLGRAVCGQGFILEDDTGSLDVLYLVRCHANETPPVITEGERVVVYATIDVSSDKLKNSEGREMLIKAMATKIIREK